MWNVTYLKQISTLAEGRTWTEETSPARNYEPPMHGSSSSAAVSRLSNGSSSLSHNSSSPELILGMSKYECSLKLFIHFQLSFSNNTWFLWGVLTTAFADIIVGRNSILKKRISSTENRWKMPQDQSKFIASTKRFKMVIRYFLS